MKIISPFRSQIFSKNLGSIPFIPKLWHIHSLHFFISPCHAGVPISFMNLFSSNFFQPVLIQLCKQNRSNPQQLQNPPPREASRYSTAYPSKRVPKPGQKTIVGGDEWGRLMWKIAWLRNVSLIPQVCNRLRNGDDL